MTIRDHCFLPWFPCSVGTLKYIQHGFSCYVGKLGTRIQSMLSCLYKSYDINNFTKLPKWYTLCTVFHVKWIFLTTNLRIPPRVDEGGIRRRVVRNPSRMENHTKCIFSHNLHFKACMLVMLNTLREVVDHDNHVRWIYLTTVLYMGGGEVRSMREKPISHYKQHYKYSQLMQQSFYNTVVPALQDHPGQRPPGL